MCCGGGQLVLEMLCDRLDAWGIDRSPRMVRRARQLLRRHGFDPQRILLADVAHLPFADGQFDSVLSGGAIALFNPALQQAAIAEMGRVARRQVRLLESFEKRKGFYWGRLLAFSFDGMHPIPPAAFHAAGLEVHAEWDIFGGAFSYLRCRKR